MSAVASARVVVAPRAAAPRANAKATRKVAAAPVAVPLAATFFAAGPALAASEAMSQVADGGSVATAVGGVAAIAGVAGVFMATDPDKRCVPRQHVNTSYHDAEAHHRSIQYDFHTAHSFAIRYPTFSLATPCLSPKPPLQPSLL
jgi:hypothetical protein